MSSHFTSTQPLVDDMGSFTQKVSDTSTNKVSEYMVAAIAPWFRLCLQSCSLGFESQAHHLHFFQFVLLKLYGENNENKQKRGRDWPIFRSKRVLYWQVNRDVLI